MNCVVDVQLWTPETLEGALGLFNWEPPPRPPPPGGPAALVTGTSLAVAGVFMVLYRDVRLLAMRDIIPWYPVGPWV